jgi:hypothetical protein
MVHLVTAMVKWITISENEYRFVFEELGGSFAVHPRAVSLVGRLAKRPVRFVGTRMRRHNYSGGSVVG